MTGANILHVPYKGAAPAVADVMGGHVAMTFVPIAAAVPPVKSGRLRALAVTGAARSAALPDVPTLSAAGVPGYEATSWNALFAPGATPRELVQKINGALVAALHAPKVRDVLASSGADAAGGSPDDLARFVRSEVEKWGKVVRAAGIKAD